jgi:hypothetical protein
MKITHTIELNNDDINAAIKGYLEENDVDVRNSAIDILLTANRRTGNKASISVTKESTNSATNALKDFLSVDPVVGDNDNEVEIPTKEKEEEEKKASDYLEDSLLEDSLLEAEELEDKEVEVEKEEEVEVEVEKEEEEATIQLDNESLAKKSLWDE